MTSPLGIPPYAYNPNRLLDAIHDRLNLQHDLALFAALEVPPSLINQIRHRGYPIGPSILIRMHDATALSVRELRMILGDRRRQIRTGYDASFLSDAEWQQVNRKAGFSPLFAYTIVALGIGAFWYFVFYLASRQAAAIPPPRFSTIAQAGFPISGLAGSGCARPDFARRQEILQQPTFSFDKLTENYLKE